MMLSGQNTRSVFDRYDVTNERDLEQAAKLPEPSAQPAVSEVQKPSHPVLPTRKLLKCRGSSLVERRPEKAGVASSILAPGTRSLLFLRPGPVSLHFHA